MNRQVNKNTFKGEIWMKNWLPHSCVEVQQFHFNVLLFDFVVAKLTPWQHSQLIIM